MRRIALIAVAVVGSTAALFALSNQAAVELRLWPFAVGFAVPLYLVVAAAALAGFLVGAIFVWYAGRNNRRNVRSSIRQVRALERELADSRSRAATDRRGGGAVRPETATRSGAL